MRKAFRTKVKLVAAGDLVRDLSAIKTEKDIASIRKAANIAAKVYREILDVVVPGMRELDVAAEISYRGRLHGSEGDAFDIIVASGKRSALPHGRATSKKIANGEMVTLDFGCIVDGFNSDMTRTFAVGEPGDEARAVYRTVYDAERAGVATARAGISARQLDQVCRDVIDEAGYGPNFNHSTGHGLGLEVHEYPAVAARSPEDLKLKAGMVVTIEPGIYLPGKFGVRIEDDVVIEEGGCRELTSPTRQLIIV
jgi:Xaa-Pro aminopeptidase